MIKAVLWDNDGVLVDSETLFFETTQAAFRELGLELSKELWATRYLGQGIGSRDIALSLGGAPDHVERMIEERNRRHRRALAQPPPLRPHVRQTLAALRRRVQLALVTGCHRDQLHLVHGASDLLSCFDVIVTGDDCKCVKPHPEPYLAALKALGVGAAECIAVEDSPRGLASARAAGLVCIVVPTELTRLLDFPGALAIEEDVSGVLKHLGIQPSGMGGGGPDRRADQSAGAGGATWSVWRQDDNGNRFEVARGLSRSRAEQRVKGFERRGHKQTYWLDPTLEG